jgi:hypothetical protein
MALLEPQQARKWGTAAVHRRFRSPNGLARPCAGPLGGFSASGNTLPDQLTLELSDRGQDLHQQRGGGARVIRVQSLRNSNEPDAERLQLLDAINAVNQAPAPTVELVDQHGIELAQSGISELVIDEAIVNGETKEPKTLASAGVMYVPPNLWLKLVHYGETVEGGPDAWLFPSARKQRPMRPSNFLFRVLKLAAIRAKIALVTHEAGELGTAVNFQSLRRTAATLFGAKAKDPRSTQAHMRLSDPQVTLKHYQREILAEVKAAALALEQDLSSSESGEGSRRLNPAAKNLPVV